MVSLTKSGMPSNLKTSRHCFQKQFLHSRRLFLCIHFQAYFRWHLIPKPFSLLLLALSYQYSDVSTSLLSYQHLSMQSFSTEGFSFLSSYPSFFLFVCFSLGDGMWQCLENQQLLRFTVSFPECNFEHSEKKPFWGGNDGLPKTTNTSSECSFFLINLFYKLITQMKCFAIKMRLWQENTRERRKYICSACK